MQEKRLLIFVEFPGQSEARAFDQMWKSSDMRRSINDLIQNYSICILGLAGSGWQKTDPYIPDLINRENFSFALITDINEVEKFVSLSDTLLIYGNVTEENQNILIAMAGYHSVDLISRNYAKPQNPRT